MSMVSGTIDRDDDYHLLPNAREVDTYIYMCGNIVDWFRYYVHYVYLPDHY